MKKFFIITVIAAFAALSCTNYGAIKLNSVELGKLNIRGASGTTVELKLALVNPLEKDIFIKKASGYLNSNGAKFARIELIKADTLHSGSSEVCSALFRVDLEDPMMIMSLGFGAGGFSFDKYTLDGAVVIGNSTGGSRKVRFKNLPVRDLVGKKESK